MKTILITGGTGFIGSAITRLALQKGFNVKVIDDNSRGAFRRLGDVQTSLEVKIGDIRDASFVSAAMKNVDIVVHLAYINGTVNFYSRPQEVLEVALLGMQNVLAGMRLHNIDELYLASSSEVYQSPQIFPTPEIIPMVVPDPYNPRYSYGLGKIVQEFMSIHSGDLIRKLIIFRPHNVYGPDMGFEHVIPELSKKIVSSTDGLVELKGDGAQTRSFCYISDFILGFNKLLDSSALRDTFNIGTEEEVSILGLANLLSKSLGREITFLGSLAPAGETNRRVPDITKLKSTGFSQVVSLEAGLQLYSDWYLDNLGEKF